MQRLFGLVVIAAFLAGLASAAQAQTVRYIKSDGIDADECTRTEPCRTLQRGIDRVGPEGEVQILDSGAYGEGLTLTKSVTISVAGAVATIGSMTINAPGAMIALRGLHVSGRNSAAAVANIFIQAANSVFIEDCDIEGAPTIARGITLGAANTKVMVSRTTVRDNGFDGILINTVTNAAQVTIKDSRFINNHGDGVRNVGGGATQATIENSVLTGNSGAGFYVGNGAIGRISNSVVTNNATGLQNSGSTLLSRGNNLVSGNTTPTTGVITALGGT
jgi:hypothetical protein